MVSTCEICQERKLRYCPIEASEAGGVLDVREVWVSGPEIYGARALPRIKHGIAVAAWWALGRGQSWGASV